MQLLGPAFLRVQMSEEQHHVRRELRVLGGAGWLALARPIEDGGGRRFGTGSGVALVQPMVGEARTQGVKVVVTPAQGGGEVLQAADIRIAGGRQPVDPRVEDIRQVDVESLIGTERRKDKRVQARRANCPMTGEIVGRIVGGTQVGHMKTVQDAVRAQFRRGEQRVGPLPNTRGSLRVKQLVDAEVALQFQVRPVIQRIAQRVRHGTGPRQELLVRSSIAGAITLADRIGPHGAPFVVIALQPDFGKVVELPVSGDVLGREMAMIVENRLTFGEGAIETFGGPVVQQKIFVDERHPSHKDTAW
jgi:hypothetical protein